MRYRSARRLLAEVDQGPARYDSARLLLSDGHHRAATLAGVAYFDSRVVSTGEGSI